MKEKQRASCFLCVLCVNETEVGCTRSTRHLYAAARRYCQPRDLGARALLLLSTFRLSVYCVCLYKKGVRITEYCTYVLRTRMRLHGCCNFVYNKYCVMDRGIPYAALDLATQCILGDPPRLRSFWLITRTFLTQGTEYAVLCNSTKSLHEAKHPCRLAVAGHR